MAVSNSDLMSTDWSAVQAAAEAKGDLAAAKRAEDNRNAKIKALNAAGQNTGGYTATNVYGAPDAFKGSTTNIGQVSPAIQSIIDQMNANSKLWWDDPGNREQYAQQNKALGQQIQNAYEQDNDNIVTYTPTFDAASGTWKINSNVQSRLAPVNITNNATKPNLMGKSLGDLYGLTYDMDQIKEILNAATQAEYGMKRQEYATTENKFYNRLSDTQATALDSMRKAQAASVATGASKGLAAASELSAILGLQQETAGLSNDLANERNKLTAEEAAAYTKNASTALNDSNAIKQAIGQLDLTKYGYDTQGYVGELDYLAALEEVLANKYASDKTLEGVKYNADANVTASQINRAGGSSYGAGGGTYNGGNAVKNYAASDAGNTGKSSSELDGLIDTGGGEYVPPGTSNIRVTKLDDGNYQYTFSGGSYIFSGSQMDKIKNNGWNHEAVTKDTYGSWEYKAGYDASGVGPQSYANWTDAQVKAYKDKTGSYPPGWTAKPKNPRYPSAGNTYTYKGTPATNKTPITGAQGEKISVGQGNYATTWTYDSGAGLWKSNTGSKLNIKDFQTYLNKQPPAYVTKIK